MLVGCARVCGRAHAQRESRLRVRCPLPTLIFVTGFPHIFGAVLYEGRGYTW